LTQIRSSKFNELNKDIIEKISLLSKEITLTNEKRAFIELMLSLSELLMTYDLSFSTAYKNIDEKATDPTYFFAAYNDTKDVDQALWIHRMVRLLTRYILLYDRFFEIGEMTYKLLATRVRRSINDFLTESDKNNDFLKRSIYFSLKQFWVFWKYEKVVKNLMLEGHSFSYQEIRGFNQIKSSDARLVYARVLDARLPSFDENVSLILHYNQALLDLLDDWHDIEDDIQDDMPNVFIMAALQAIPYHRLKNSGQHSVRNIMIEALNSSSAPIIKLVNEYQTSVKNILIPDNFAFLKVVSDFHVDSLKKTILL